MAYQQAVAEEKERRKQVELQRSQRMAEEHREKLLRTLRKAVDDDEAFQLKSNRPNKVVGGGDLVAAGHAAFDEQDFAVAAAKYKAALGQRGFAKNVALLDNCAVAYLLAGQPAECAKLCTECERLDPTFLPAVLHHARALRALNLVADAYGLLRARLLHDQHYEALRESLLCLLQLQDERDPRDPPVDEDTLLEILHITEPLTGESLMRAFRAAVVRWHPDFFYEASPDQRGAAMHELHLCWQAWAILNDPQRMQDRATKEEYWKKVHLPAHVRKPWIYKPTRVQVERPGQKGNSLVRQVPQFSPLSLGTNTAAPVGSAGAVASSALLYKALASAINDFALIRGEWIWEPPVMNDPGDFDRLLEQVSIWKLELYPDHKPTDPSPFARQSPQKSQPQSPSPLQQDLQQPPQQQQQQPPPASESQPAPAIPTSYTAASGASPYAYPYANATPLPSPPSRKAPVPPSPSPQVTAVSSPGNGQNISPFGPAGPASQVLGDPNRQSSPAPNAAPVAMPAPDAKALAPVPSTAATPATPPTPPPTAPAPVASLAAALLDID